MRSPASCKRLYSSSESEAVVILKVSMSASIASSLIPSVRTDPSRKNTSDRISGWCSVLRRMLVANEVFPAAQDWLARIVTTPRGIPPPSMVSSRENPVGRGELRLLLFVIRRPFCSAVCGQCGWEPPPPPWCHSRAKAAGDIAAMQRRDGPPAFLQSDIGDASSGWVRRRRSGLQQPGAFLSSRAQRSGAGASLVGRDLVPASSAQVSPMDEKTGIAAHRCPTFSALQA
jgi:hypothetical protein